VPDLGAPDDLIAGVTPAFDDVFRVIDDAVLLEIDRSVENGGYYSAARPCIKVISAFAIGSDQIGAESALKLKDEKQGKGCAVVKGNPRHPYILPRL